MNIIANARGNSYRFMALNACDEKKAERYFALAMEEYRSALISNPTNRVGERERREREVREGGREGKPWVGKRERHERE